MTTLDEVKQFGSALSPWAHIATVRADGTPDVVPVHPAWEGGTLWFMCGASSAKARNVRAHPAVALHWQVSEKGDGLEVWGDAEVFTDLETKRRLWNGVFDYDLDLFAPGGPEGSPDTAFIAVTPRRALIVEQYGAGGMHRWRA
jgi:general stress protein 26